MITFSYKGWFIHDNFNAGKVKVQSPNFDITPVKSVHAAKCFITRQLKLGRVSHDLPN